MRSGTRTVLSVIFTSFFLWLTGKFLLPLCFPFLLGTGLALTAEPLVRLLSVRCRLPRGLAAGIGVSAAFCGIAGVILLFLAFLVRELGLLAGILPDLSETARSGISLLQGWLTGLAGRTPPSIRPLLEQNIRGLFSGGTALMDRGFSYLLGLAGTILTHVPDSALSLGTAVISAFMISAKFPQICRWLQTSFPRERLRPLLQTCRQLRRALGAWLLAQLRLAGVTLVILGVGLLLLRIPYALLWAAGICLVDAFPVLGTGTVLLPWGLVCYLQGDRARAIGLVGIYVVISLTRSVLEPKLVGRQLGLDPLVTLFALYAGFKLWGIGGMILSPLLAVTVVQLLPENRKT